MAYGASAALYIGRESTRVLPQGGGSLALVPRLHTTYSHGKEAKKDASKDLKVLFPTSRYSISSVDLRPGRIGLAVPELLL